MAIGILKRQFGRSDSVVNERLDKLLSLSPVVRSEDVNALRALFDNVTFRTICLEGSGVPPAQDAVLLHRMFLRSLPDDIAIAYRQRAKESVSSV